MPKPITVLGQQISIEAVVLVALGAAASMYVVRELLSLIFWRALILWAGVSTALVAFGFVALWAPNADNIKKKKKSLKQTLVPLAFTRKWSASSKNTENTTVPEAVYPQSFLVSTAIDQLIEYIIRDFVSSWFQGISQNQEFPMQVDSTIRHALIMLSMRMKDIEWSDMLVTKMMPIVTDHFHNFVAAETAVRERSMGRDLTDNKEFQYAVAGQYCHGRLHPSVALKHYRYADYRKGWLRNLVDRFIPLLLGTSSSSIVVNHLSRDILACSVLFPVLSMFSDSDFWNQMIVNTAGPTLQDRQKVEKLMKALNEHATGNANGSKSVTIRLSPTADQGAYEKFIRDINKIRTLPEARQARYYMSVQLKRSVKQGNNPVYVSRLQTAKNMIDRQIAKISGQQLERRSTADLKLGGINTKDPREDYTLKDILNDPACAVYFMEYMDQSRRTMLVQFWLTVNSLRNPLEDDINDNDTNDTTTTTINENDIAQIYKTYFNGRMPYISAENEKAVAMFVKSKKQSPEQYIKARNAILQTQASVYKAMKVRDLVNFKKSDLFLKFLASDRTVSSASNNSPSATKSSVDALQLDSIDYQEPGDTFKAVAAVEEAFNNIMESTPVNSKPNAFLDDEEKPKKDNYKPLFESDSETDSEEDDNEDSEGDGASTEGDELHLAAPGDLSLTEAISILSSEIDVLYRQEAVLEPLLHKAELTNNIGNLRILRKSKASLEKEIQRKELQRQQYIVQESDNSLFGRSNIQIRSYMSSSDQGGHYMLYIIEVERLASDGSVSAGWVVARRYSQFFQLHQHLRTRFPQVKKLDFPKKGVVLKFQHKSFVDARKIALQNYLRELLKMPDVCRSKSFRLFLSSETFSLDSLSSNASTETSSLNDGDTEEIDLRKSITSDIDAEAELDLARPFIQPICDLFIQVFGFDRGNNWLRGRAVVVVVQQILGGTIEKKIRESVAGLANEQNITNLIQKITDSIWPEGKMKGPSPVRTNSEKLKCKHDAEVIVHGLIRDASIKIVGGSSSRYASTHVFGMFQNEILNAHLVYTLLDVIIEQLFD